jgi:hypothetical protein
METDNEKLKVVVNESIRQRETELAPAFDETWLAAEAQYLAEKRRYRHVTAIAASAAIFAVVIGLFAGGEESTLPDFELTTGILETTQWSAPSDVLLPDYSVDIYGELPSLPASTDWYEETLL